MVLAVADGVGSRPCDWRASEVACTAALEGIEEASGALPERIEAGVKKAHWTVGRETGRCGGMLAAIVVAAWPPGADEVACAGVGDARIYRVRPGRAQQVTEDDVETKTIRQDSRTSLPGAPSTYRRDFLTQALGASYDLDIDARRISFPPGAGLALATDGAYPVGGFKSKVVHLYESNDLQAALKDWMCSSNINNRDDATLALLRRSGLTETIREQCLRLLERSVDCRSEGMAPHLMVQVLLGEIEQALQEGDEKRIRECARYMQVYSIGPGQGALGDILDRIAEHPALGEKTFERVHRLIQRSA